VKKMSGHKTTTTQQECFRRQQQRQMKWRQSDTPTTHPYTHPQHHPTRGSTCSNTPTLTAMFKFDEWTEDAKKECKVDGFKTDHSIKMNGRRKKRM
jgi:hypothetical protein